jgi:hypothetical protein
VDEPEQFDPGGHIAADGAKARGRKISQAKQTRGVIVVATGNGKTTPAASAWQRGRLDTGCRSSQFIKGSFSTGESLFRRFPEVRYHVMGEGYLGDAADRDRDIEARAAWDQSVYAPGRGLNPCSRCAQHRAQLGYAVSGSSKPAAAPAMQHDHYRARRAAGTDRVRHRDGDAPHQACLRCRRGRRGIEL